MVRVRRFGVDQCVSKAFCCYCYFSEIFSEKEFSSNSKSVICANEVIVPPWLSKYPSLFSNPSPTLVPNSSDTLEWRDESGFARGFSAHVVWNTIRHKNDKVDWCDVVWFSCCIPCHAVHLRLVLRRSLKTQDQLRPWDATSVIFVVCPLCETQPDSHDHLFFECVYSQQVWHGLKALAGLPNSSDAMDEVVSDILPFVTRRTSKSIIAKLVVAATWYFIWQERNGRLFKNSKRMVNQVVECIMHTVRLKLLSCRFKTTRSALEMINAWNLSESILVSILWHVTYGLVEVQALLELASIVGFEQFSWWFHALFLVPKVLLMSRDDMQYSCLIEYPNHFGMIAKIWM
ncbi:reverse transcriptase domain, reverse transcriptase zinc-binding domain protein [Tanacetum coccineum]